MIGRQMVILFTLMLLTRVTDNQKKKTESQVERNNGMKGKCVLPLSFNFYIWAVLQAGLQ